MSLDFSGMDDIMAGGNTISQKEAQVKEILGPLRAQSLVEAFVARFEELIISGEIGIGSRLPSERELAVRMGVSRPVVHEGLIELQARGLVTMKPRKGAYVNDYRRRGSLSILESLLAYHKGKLDPGLLRSMLRMRELFEIETARLAARNRSPEHLRQFGEVIERESGCDLSETGAIVEIDFEFHLLTAIATGNLVYPLIMNSFKDVYTNLTGQFFADPIVAPEVFAFHRGLVRAYEARDEKKASVIMKRLLDHGERYLNRTLEQMNAAVSSEKVV